MMRRALITTGTTAAGIVLLLSLKPHQSTLETVSSPLSTGETPTTQPSQSSQSSQSDQSDQTSTDQSTTSGSSDGTFTGDTVQTRFGPVQVKITVKNGKLTKVEALQYPDHDHHSIQISDYVIPTLNDEAVAAGNANLDNISGATYTTQAYIESLQSALDQAGVR